MCVGGSDELYQNFEDKRMRSAAVDVACFLLLLRTQKYKGWNFNSGNYLFTTDTK